MKKLKQITRVVATITLVALASCSSNNDGGNPGVAAEGTIIAKIDGNQFTSLEITTFASVVSGGGQTTLVIQGNTSSQAIHITVNGYDGIGTYQISDSNVFIIASYIEPNVNDPLNSQTWSAPFDNSGVIGEIKVSEETDAKIVGTFYFTCKNPNDGTTKKVSEGSFNVSKMAT